MAVLYTVEPLYSGTIGTQLAVLYIKRSGHISEVDGGGRHY